MSATPAYELYRIVTDYEALQDGFLDRLDELDTTMSLPSFADGEVQKLLSKIPGKQICRPRDQRHDSARRKFGWESLEKMLRDTGLALVLVVDDARFAPVKEQLAKRRRRNLHSARPKWLFTSKKASKISKNRWADIPPETRKKIMRKVRRGRNVRRRRQAIAAHAATA